MIRPQKCDILRLIRVWCYLLPLQSSLFVDVYGQCIPSINELETAESQVTDFSVERQYILCPQSTYTIGRQDYFGTLLFETGSHMIRLRPNLHIQCGDTGERSNNCVINGGTVQVDGTSFFDGSTAGSTVLSNVKVTGLTFTNVEKYHVWIDQPGEVAFRDCAFQVRKIFGLLYGPTEVRACVCLIRCFFCRIRRTQYYQSCWIISIRVARHRC